MKTYLVEYFHQKARVKLTTYIDAEDKTQARDLFFESFPEIEEVERITWVPSTDNQ